MYPLLRPIELILFFLLVIAIAMILVVSRTTVSLTLSLVLDFVVYVSTAVMQRQLYQSMTVVVSTSSNSWHYFISLNV